jgi:hypothetical protein
MVIDNFYFVRVTIRPSETDSPLTIDANTVLSGTVTAKFLEPVPRRNPQIFERAGAMHDHELLKHGAVK